jgi:hypothetical protein
VSCELPDFPRVFPIVWAGETAQEVSMRTPIGIFGNLGLSAMLLALCCATAEAAPAAKPATPKAAPRAASAEHHGVAASAHAPGSGRGYSAQSRHMADCLATYSGRYDPLTDTVALPGGATRRCGL